jgi:hypothetical protein
LVSLGGAIAILLTLVSIAAAASHRADRMRLAFALVSGAIMIAFFAGPLVSQRAAAALLLALMLAGVLQVLVRRLRTGDQLDQKLRVAVAIPLVDAGFMALAMAMMPAMSLSHVSNGAGLSTVSEVTSLSNNHSVATLNAVHGMSMTEPAGALIWVILLGWAATATILIVPRLLDRSGDGIRHAVCTGGMIAAMGVMFL